MLIQTLVLPNLRSFLLMLVLGLLAFLAEVIQKPTKICIFIKQSVDQVMLLTIYVHNINEGLLGSGTST